MTASLLRPQNEAVQALRRAQLQYAQRSEDLRVRSQASPEDPAPQAQPGPNKQQERRRRSREEAQAKVGTRPRAPLCFGAPGPTICPTHAPCVGPSRRRRPRRCTRPASARPMCGSRTWRPPSSGSYHTCANWCCRGTKC